MQDNAQSLPNLLSNLHDLSTKNEDLWQRTSPTSFRATLSAGTIEIEGAPTPYGLRTAIQQTWVGTTGMIIWEWITVPIRPVLYLAASKTQPTFKWPDRTLTITSVNGSVNEFFVDRDNPIYSQVSQLLLVAELAVQTSDLADTIDSMSQEIEEFLTPDDEDAEPISN